MTPLTLGFMPLTDCVPLVVAKHFGFFERFGLDVHLARQNSWATLRDKVHAGLLDAAHMLAPMPFASSLGLGGHQTPIMTPFILARHGNAITLSNKLFAEIQQTQSADAFWPMPASALSQSIAERKARGEKLTFATVFPYSCHFYQLKSWLTQYHVPLDSVDIVFIPPSHMVDAMRTGQIDGFCVGNPWNALAVRAGIGKTVVTSPDIWPAMPEKVLGMKESFYAQNESSVIALILSITEACKWLSSLPNRFEAARLLCDDAYLSTNLDVVAPSLLGSCITGYRDTPRNIWNYTVFGAETSSLNNCPTVSQGEWIVNQMASVGHIDSQALARVEVAQMFRADIYQSAINAQ